MGGVESSREREGELHQNFPRESILPPRGGMNMRGKVAKEGTITLKRKGKR